MSIEKDKFPLRLLLFITLVYTLSLPLLPAANTRLAGATELEEGMGGGLTTVQFDFDLFEEDLDLFGVLEPAEFSRPKLLVFDTYRVKSGDTISEIAMSMGLNEDTLLSVNGIRNSRLLQINQVLKIPNQDGIYHNVSSGETLSSISERYNAEIDSIKIVNEMFSDYLVINSSVFIPSARMDWIARQEINGDLFIWPVTGRITSPYGMRNDPFGRGRLFHNGIDIGASSGTPIRAAMSGRVLSTAYNEVYGNFVVITHHSGYRTFYAHMNTISVRPGANVVTGERIGQVGTTGLVTGPHLHFTVYKDGVTVNPRILMR